MRLDQITLKNYRCFGQLTVDLHPQLTVLVAPNGVGKTTVLDAIKVALWPFVAGFDLGSTTNDITGIHIEDVRREYVQTHEMDWRLPAEIKAIGQAQVRRLVLDGTLIDPTPQPIGVPRDLALTFHENLPWSAIRSRESIKKGTKTKDTGVTGALSLLETAKVLERRIFSGKQAIPDDLPMLGYYGTGRLWAQKKLMATHEKADDQALSRTFAYRDCLDPASSYKHFAVWFTRVHKSLLQAQFRNFEKRLPLDADVPYGLVAPFKAVQNAVSLMLEPHTGWHNLEYSAEFEELMLHHPKQGQLKVSQLSDGIRNILALVGDIAYRCYKLNAHLGEAAPQRTYGIVLIDEVDMHLHPSWQQTVLTNLITAFPKLQFIITTHSPQVLTSVDAACIRKLVLHENTDTGAHTIAVERVGLQTRGVASADVLADIMGVDPVPDVTEARQLAEFHSLIQQNLHDTQQAQVLRQGLDAHFGENHPVMRECDRMIRLQAFKQRLPVQRSTADPR